VNPSPVPSFTQTQANNLQSWKRFWTSTAAVDFSGSTDKRAFELERRIILSQYLIKIRRQALIPHRKQA
jgi:hypothetical protein